MKKKKKVKIYTKELDIIISREIIIIVREEEAFIS